MQPRESMRQSRLPLRQPNRRVTASCMASNLAINNPLGPRPTNSLHPLVLGWTFHRSQGPLVPQLSRFWPGVPYTPLPSEGQQVRRELGPCPRFLTPAVLDPAPYMLTSGWRVVKLRLTTPPSTIPKQDAFWAARYPTWLRLPSVSGPGPLRDLYGCCTTLALSLGLPSLPWAFPAWNCCSPHLVSQEHHSLPQVT